MADKKSAERPKGISPYSFQLAKDLLDKMDNPSVAFLAGAIEQIRRDERDDLYSFVKEIADEPCYESPGEFPEPGESGQAPCLSCQARSVIAKVKK